MLISFYHFYYLFLFFFFERKSHYVAQIGLMLIFYLMGLSAGIMSVCHYTW